MTRSAGRSRPGGPEMLSGIDARCNVNSGAVWPRLVISAAMVAVGFTWTAAGDAPTVSAILTSSQSRANYLAHARIWKDPGVVSPEDVLDGPSGVFPYTFAEATSDEGIACTFAKRGKDLGGATVKFLCTTGNGQTLRIKYWNPDREQGNREVFAMVAATRLMWALGFDTLPALPLNVRCDRCPENPMTGEGEPATRHYLGELQAFPPGGPLILSGDDRNQGWSWRELDDAISALPPGPGRIRQRTHYDALTLLGVFIQHGDRKAEQQALYCSASVNLAAGTTIPKADGDRQSILLLEGPTESSCAQSAAMIVDVGATFGGAGRTSSDKTAKMDLDQWRHRPVFHKMTDGVCRGDLTVSYAARHDGEGDPVVSEDGRAFLLDQLHRLTPAHVRALFTAARVEDLGKRSIRTKAAGTKTATDEWVDVFQDKVRQIEAQRCRPAS